MKLNELIKVGERTEIRERIIPSTYDEEGNLLTEETTEAYEVIIPIMETVTRDMTAEEEAEFLANQPVAEEPQKSDAERIAELENAIRVLLSGVTE